LLEILGYIVVAYGIARLVQTSTETETPGARIAGVVGILALAVLALMLHDQASSVSQLGV
jgi:multisubunit Na+/H+ antiporter MnhB subunit